MIDKTHYTNNYDSLKRFISYYNQSTEILNLHPQSILEIGVGNHTLSNYLKENGLNITTCDYDETVSADFHSDIRNMSCFKDSSFDVVVAFEVLEHLQWEDLDKALSELKRVTKKNVIISVPWTGWAFNMNIQIPFVKEFNIGFWISRFWVDMKPREQHMWEIGFKNYPLKKVRDKFEEYFKIEREYRSPVNRYHHYFVLTK